MDKYKLRQFMYEMADEVTPPVENTPPVDIPQDKTPEDTKEEIKPEDTKEKQDDKPETPENPPAKETEDVTELKEELKRLQDEVKVKSDLELKVADIESTVTQLNNDLKSKGDLVTEYEAMINGIIESKLEAIPEKLKELVPNNLGLKEKLEWINKAESNGLFKQEKQAPDVEIGKPLNPKNPQQNIDTTKLSASSLMAMAYSNSKGKKR